MNQENNVKGMIPEDVRVGYQAAIEMAVYDGQLSWQVTGIFMQFAILMVAGAVFPSFVGSKNNLILAIAGLTVSLGGIIMTFMFGSMVTRFRTYEEYWVLCATQLESYMSDSVKTFEGSMLLSRDGHFTIGENIVRMRRISAIKSKMMLGAFFISFLIIFLCLFAINVWRIMSAI